MSTEATLINWQALGVYFYIAQWVFNIGLAVWVYFRDADSQNTKAIKAVADDLAKFIKESGKANEDQNTRLTKVETTVEHLPTDQEVAQIASDMSSVKSRQEGMDELLRRVEHQTNLIHEHLLRNAR